MVISSFISSILVLALGIWAYLRLEPCMNSFAEKQLLIEPSKFSYRMWKDMPVTMYQSFTFFNLTNWNQVKSIGQKPRFVEVGPYVYKTIWSKADVNFLDDDKFVNFAEKKQWHFQAHLSRGYEDDLIWTINTPLMTALALIQNAPVITRNIVSVILDGLGEGAFIKRPIRSLLFEGYSDLIVSVGPLFDRRFANFNGKFAYLYNKNDTVDGHWTVATGVDDLTNLNKITRFSSAIVNMTSFSSGQMPQGLNEVKAECAPAWSLDQSTNGQLFAPFNRDNEQQKLQRQLQQIKSRTKQQQDDQRATQNVNPNGGGLAAAASSRTGESIVQAPKRFFSRISSSVGSTQSAAAAAAAAAAAQHNQNDPHNNQHHLHHNNQQQQQQQAHSSQQLHSQFPPNVQEKLQQLKDFGKYIFYPDLCRPIHLLPSKQQVTSDNGIQASRYFIDPRVFMNSSQMATNKCYEMNPRPPLANALAATINSVTGANVNVPNLVSSASSPFALFIPPNINGGGHHHHHHHHHNSRLSSEQQPSAASHHHHHEPLGGGIFERAAASHPSSILNNALHTLQASANQAADQLASASSNSPISRLGRVRQMFSNIVSQRMSANPLLPSLAAARPSGLLMGANHHHHFPGAAAGAAALLTARNAPGPDPSLAVSQSLPLHRQQALNSATLSGQDPSGASGGGLVPMALNSDNLQATGLPATTIMQDPAQPPIVATQPPLMVPPPLLAPQTPALGGSDRWVTQFRFKWPRGVFSIGQCQLGAPIYVSLPHFLDADEYYLEQVDGLRPNRSLHEFYIDVESSLHSIPVNAKARLQLNVATPELRFRNIPNAMIPVLWQEVTFKIDKPIATMLYWSFTMSSTIYKITSIVLMCAGTILLVLSFVGSYKSRSRDRSTATTRPTRRTSSVSDCNRTSCAAGDTAHMCSDLDQRDRMSCTSGSHHSDITSCTTTHESGPNCAGCLFACLRHSQHGRNQIGSSSCQQLATGSTASDISDQVVRQLQQHQHQHQQQQQQQQQQHHQLHNSTTGIITSDIDRATLSSSRSSNLDSCSSIYTTSTTRRNKKFKS